MDNLFWIGHASFYIKAKQCSIFIDPFNVPNSLHEKADIVLVTHAHFDHCSEIDIKKVAKGGTTIIASEHCKINSDITAKPGFKTSIKNIEIEAVPAYNIKSERQQFHPKSNNWVGYLITADGFTVYHAGDTDFIPDMKKIKADVALIPIGGTYTMDVNEGIEAANAISAGKIVPIHYKHLLGIEGSKSAEELFKEKVKNAVIMKEIAEPDYSPF